MILNVDLCQLVISNLVISLMHTHHSTYFAAI